MTEATNILSAPRAGDNRVIGTVSAAHFVSHYYILLLPPLFLFVRDEYGVSYTELGLALTVFNVVSAVGQTPTGFLVDRLGARVLLIAGLLLGATAFAVAGLVHSYWVLVAMFGVAGLANTVYHPADYAILSQHVSAERISRAFSIHSFAGMLGSAAAPGTLLMMQTWWGWRGAFLGTAVLGFAVAALLAAQRETVPVATATDKAETGNGQTGWRLLFSTPILLNLVFFILLAMFNGGLSNYTVVALGALYGTGPVAANTALSGYLLLMAIGILVGGFLASRTDRHSLVAAICLTIASLSAVLIAQINLGDTLIILVLGVGGFFSGLMTPSRDLLVRAVTPPGSFGKVFGFVTTGFNVGGVVSPILFGAIMDHGEPRYVFLGVAAFCAISILTVLSGPPRRR